MKKHSGYLWGKKGLLILGGGGVQGYTHASHPCILQIDDDIHLLIFSMRDINNFSSIFTCLCKVKDGFIEIQEIPKLKLSPGRKGTFDSEGLLSCCVVNVSNVESYLYYSGWNNLSDGLWLCDTGLASINHDDLSISRKYEGPIMSRDRHNPYFAAGTSVLREGSFWRSWYNSGISWTQNQDSTWKPLYGIHYAESMNGIDWNYFPGLVIPLKDPSEHSFGRPTVVKWGGQYLMWFSYRGANNNPNYRIGFAESSDGLRWNRDDELSGIRVSNNPEDFDSEAVAYPYPFEHKGIFYLLYNGNSYGKTGFGYAVMERV